MFKAVALRIELDAPGINNTLIDSEIPIVSDKPLLKDITSESNSEELSEKGLLKLMRLVSDTETLSVFAESKDLISESAKVIESDFINEAA